MRLSDAAAFRLCPGRRIFKRTEINVDPCRGLFYLSHLLTRIMAHTYESWGYLKKDGALYGALSSFGIMSWMELGDSFSDYGFSHEDFIMNALGSLAGHFLHTHPALADIIDFRFEYRPRFDELDIFTDYEHSKFLKLFP